MPTPAMPFIASSTFNLAKDLTAEAKIRTATDTNIIDRPIALNFAGSAVILLIDCIASISSAKAAVIPFKPVFNFSGFMEDITKIETARMPTAAAIFNNAPALTFS